MKVIAGLATIPERMNTLKGVIDSLVGQVDELYVGFNYGEVEIPSFIKDYDNVYYWHNHINMGDAEKFLHTFIRDVIYLGCDDDLIYPQGYAQYMAEGVDKYNGLVSLHGKKYLAPVVSYKQWAGNYRCLDLVSEDIKYINLIGSGCCAFNTDRLKISLEDFKRPNMADVFLSQQATLQGVPMVVLAHEKGYLQYTYPQGKTIWQNTSDYSYHVQVMNTFIK